jgi:hypothetical protein
MPRAVRGAAVDPDHAVWTSFMACMIPTVPSFRLWPATYPITVDTASPAVGVDSDDIERIGVIGNSWGDRWWKGAEIAAFRRRLEERHRVAKSRSEVSSSDRDVPLSTVIEGILAVVHEAERVHGAYHLWYVGD